MQLCFVAGTRPEFIKLRSVIAEAIAKNLEVRLVHTGQHYDPAMSDSVIRDLDLPEPDLFLGSGPSGAGTQLGGAIPPLIEAFAEMRPSAVIVVGDTNTTLAAALAAMTSNIALVHVEAGVRSFDYGMPEEINRRAVDAIATVCFAPTERAVRNLNREGRGPVTWLAGDTLVESSLALRARALSESSVLEVLGLSEKAYTVITLHRAENVDREESARELVAGLAAIPGECVFPMHPRTRKTFESFGLLKELSHRVRVIPPLGFRDFIVLASGARLIVTDSGGVQQEASIFGVPVITPRWNTEWIETVEAGQNVLTGVDAQRIASAARDILENAETYRRMSTAKSPFVPGAAARIVDVLAELFTAGSLRIPRSNFVLDGLPQ